jgi:uncharacterized protein
MVNLPLISPLYAATLALLFLVLSVRTLRLRRQLKISLGDAGDRRMLRAMRVHSNFAEYVPLALVLMLMLELQGTRAGWLHGLGATLVLARALHAYGVSQGNEQLRFRVAGVVLTLTCIALSALALILNSLV